MKLFVWDFHGVLEKDNDKAVLEITNQVLADAGYAERFSEEEGRKLYGLKWYQYFETLLPHLTKDQHMDLQSACFAFAEKNLHVLEKRIKPNDYAQEVLAAIKHAGHDQIIVSNTRQPDLEWFVNAVHIGAYFPKGTIFGVNAHQKNGNKVDALRAYIRNKTYDDIIIVGDSQSDMDLQDITGGTTYFYTHPHIHGGAQKADHHIKDLRAILVEL